MVTGCVVRFVRPPPGEVPNASRHTVPRPAVYVCCVFVSIRVNFWDSAKWVSRVRAANTGSAPVILRVSDSDGHDGPDDAFDGLRDSALEMAFLEEHL